MYNKQQSIHYNNNEACKNMTACLICHATIYNKQVEFSNSVRVTIIWAIFHRALNCINYADSDKTALNSRGLTLCKARQVEKKKCAVIFNITGNSRRQKEIIK